jgi:predicted esterase
MSGHNVSMPSKLTYNQVKAQLSAGFDVWNVNNFADREELQAEGLREVIPPLRRILAAEASRLSGHFDRVLLAGISMGGATSAHLLFSLDNPLGAFLGFSCRCPFAGQTLAGMRTALALEGVPEHGEVVRGTPVLLEHCANDPLVQVANGRLMRETLVGFGADVDWREYPTGGHWFNAAEGMDDVVEFVRRVVLGGGGSGSARGKGKEAIGVDIDLPESRASSKV